MQHEFGVKPSDVEWVQGRADRLGRKLPADIKLTQAPAGTELGDMLERGEIDFMITANNPLSFRRGSPRRARGCSRTTPRWRRTITSARKSIRSCTRW